MYSMVTTVNNTDYILEVAKRTDLESSLIQEKLLTIYGDEC